MSPDPATAARRNVRAFTAFRICFAARFYYPVYTVLFLDYGLTLEEFGILNAVWAATIFFLEVPSGALADTIGRRNLLVAAGIMMIIEMAVLLAAPINGGSLMFTLFLINRVLSGVAEAAASGADEALAYDSLKAAGQEGRWGRVLERVQRDTSIAFFVAMMLGAAVYDPRMVNAVLVFLGLDARVETADLIKVPVALTFVTAVCTFLSALWMVELRGAGERRERRGRLGRMVRDSSRKILRAASWIWVTPMAFGVVLATMLVDSLVRLFLTLASEYWRVIEYPVVSLGLIGSGMALLGLFVPRIARLMTERGSPVKNLVATFLIVLAGFTGLAFAVPWWGLLPAVLLQAAFMLANFFASKYLNEAADSDQRATILSFRSLATNMLYGSVSLGYSGLVAYLKLANEEAYAGLDPDAMKSEVFVAALGWLPGYFAATVAVFALVMVVRFGRGR